MITLSPEKDIKVVKKLFNDEKIEFCEFSVAVTAKDKDEILGYCLFDLTPEAITVHTVQPNNDIMLLDGILRSALHVAAERSIMDARYSETAPEAVFETIGFIKDKSEKKLDIDKLFGGCHCGK